MFGIARAKRRNSLATCSASSRVGHKTNDWVLNNFASIRCNKPKPNAAVLPLPVLACARTSFPARIAGRAAA